MVIAHHFDTHIPAYVDASSYSRPFYDGLGTYLFHGHLAVAIFFMLSGFFSYRTLSAANFDAVRWIKKRIARLLIPLWLAWPIGYGVLLLAGTLVQGDAKIAPLAILGLDGYLTTYFSIRSWHVVGEWYTGALILVILVMPLLHCAMRHWGVSKCFAGLLCLELVAGLISCGVGTDIFWRSPLVCVVSYTAGMILCHLKKASFYGSHNIPAWLIAFVILISSFIVRSIF